MDNVKNGRNVCDNTPSLIIDLTYLLLFCLLPQSDNCVADRLSVSLSGDSSLADAHLYCGTGTFSVESQGNRIVIGLSVSSNSIGGTFKCSLKATEPQIPPDTCDCGWKKQVDGD
jgi:hypothetical protein